MHSFTALITSVLALTGTAVAAAIDTPNTIEKRGYGPAPNGKTMCPGGQGLFFKAKSGLQYQVACSVDVAGGTLLAVYPNLADALACTAQCDLWSEQVPNRKCTASTFYKSGSPDGVNNCFIRNGIWTAFEPADKAISSFP